MVQKKDETVLETYYKLLICGIMKISVVINTYNAEKYLNIVLDSVKDFDEILICDMYSTDQTIEIAHQYGARIVYHENVGYADPARTFAIQSAKYDWVLMIDADEIVPPLLKDYLYNIIRQPNCPAGLRIPLKNYFMGRFMRCTYPNYVLRFFKREGTLWPPVVHSQPIVNGQICNIPATRKDLAFIHLANDNVGVFIRKMNVYTEFERKKRETKQYNYLSVFGESFFRFFKHYILKGAMLDGKAGLIYAGLLSVYKFVTIAKIWEERYKYKDMYNDMHQIDKFL